MGGRDVSHVVHIEAQNRAHFGLREKILHSVQAFTAQPVKIDSLLPIDRHRPIGW
jgi:hypothetical protein